MRNLILIFALFVGLFSNAQSTIEVTYFNDGDLPLDRLQYKHTKGASIAAEKCFDDFLITRIDVLTMNTAASGESSLSVLSGTTFNSYKIVPGSVNLLAEMFSSYSGRDEVRLVSDNSIVEEDILACPGVWTLVDREWRTNPDFTGWAYNEYIRGGRYNAALTDSYTGFANNNRYNPRGDLNVPFNNGNGFASRELLEDAIEEFIRNY